MAHFFWFQMNKWTRIEELLLHKARETVPLDDRQALLVSSLR